MITFCIGLLTVAVVFSLGMLGWMMFGKDDEF